MSVLHDLRWEIQQELHQLTCSHSRDLLYKLAESFRNEVEEELPDAESTEVELFDFIVDFLRSPQLKRLKDQGMSRLLAFRDLIRELQSPPPAVMQASVGQGPVEQGAVGEAAVVLPASEVTDVAPVISEESAPSDITVMSSSPSVIADPVTEIMVDQCKEELQTALQNNDLSLAAKEALKYLDMINNVSLNIAITGESGSGKSSIVNVLRGIKNKTDGAAPTSPVETTKEPTPYPYPKQDNIKIWDLPGIGTINFKADEYLQQVEFEKYDFFIIVSNDRFKENDAKLAQEIQRMNKKFYFVRSKIDQSIQGEIECDPDLKEDDLLKTIRDDCIKGLQDLGIQSPNVFLVCGLKRHLYDFENFCKKFQEELPERQLDALIIALPVNSIEVIEQKKKALEKKIKWYILASAAGAAVPIPGISEGLDLSMIIKFTIECRNALGLTPDSLEKLSSLSSVPVEDLKAVVKSLLSSSQVTKNLVLKVLSTSAIYITATSIEEGSRFIPLIGIPVAMSLSSLTTYRALNYVLNTLTEDAKQVLRAAQRGNKSE
ncbi:hypothetical protein NL108_013382 [Boleophthalmus pectinirostris]|uniref:interferon-inducible GTPase 5-like n=1 Tax=Boleophthalmus pectinirostris TaxID=150288 RepID=UPI00242F0491|nr:interferon-inducible GTPase 5-like [Boleophthalmus pectinirostris]XP_055013656.1 interferon-inducible GTPase 5-like [Boleophthalmus pectinirostris]XP_055013658.1 interferon-inducible GTPase 5-like [Boleophthalmus pectinirostris]KAJ0063211.1 hypothetical protein NL108_013382 [Boleophthalmus pectinirostris]